MVKNINKLSLRHSTKIIAFGNVVSKVMSHLNVENANRLLSVPTTYCT